MKEEFGVPHVTLKKTHLNEVIEIFERINTSGTKLTVFDLLIAKLSLHKINLKKLWDKVQKDHKDVHDYDAFLLENHGALTIGPNVINAYHKMETMEHFAKIYLVARMLGNVNTIGDEDVGKLLNLRERFGVTTQAVCQLDLQEKKAQPSPVQPSASNSTGSVSQEELVQRITREVVSRLSGTDSEDSQARIIPVK